MVATPAVEIAFSKKFILCSELALFNGQFQTSFSSLFEHKIKAVGLF